MTWIQTVRGRVDASEIGFTLPHEHTYIDLWTLEPRFDFPAQFNDADLLAAELVDYKAHGGDCVVDVTVQGMGRDAAGVRSLSERTDVHIVLGTGYYRQPYYPPEARIDRRHVDSIAEDMIREFADGIEGTGVRPGIIGEIGANKDWVSAQEERVFRAAARAQRATGLAITTHALLSPVGLDQLDLLDEEGADMGRVAIGHCDWYPNMKYYREIIRRGAFVELDCFGQTDALSQGLESVVLELLLQLLHDRLENHILLSHDMCLAANMRRFGGQGYSYVQRSTVPYLLGQGVPQDVIDTMTIENPRRLLAFEA
jgi:predicted metal-dependent phosphotriesterase family hydrolase